MSSKQRKVAELLPTLEKLLNFSSLDLAEKLFEDEYFIVELIKILYEDNVDLKGKMNVMRVIEQVGSGMLKKDSVDQAITALLDVLANVEQHLPSVHLTAQLLITITTIFIDHQELLDTELCLSFISTLMERIKKLNHIPSRRIRAVSCCCLVQIETFKPGILWRWRDFLNRLAREEKTDISQDYLQLLVTVYQDGQEADDSKALPLPPSQGQGQAPKRMESVDTRKPEIDDKDLLPVVSLAMDSVFLATPPGLSNMAVSIVHLLQNHGGISPTVFKPLMLQCLPSKDTSILHLMLFIQLHFRGEILSAREEKLLMTRALASVNHAGNNNQARLLNIQWILSFLGQEQVENMSPLIENQVAPTVFEPLPLHVCKLILRCMCAKAKAIDLSDTFHYLTQLAETTGGIQVTRALYLVVFAFVRLHRAKKQLHQTVLSTTRNLFQKFSHLIPLIVDFIRAVRTAQPETDFHGEMLCLLHNSAPSLPLSTLLGFYHNYLQVWLLSAQDAGMPQKRQLRRLLELVHKAVSRSADDWSLGNLVLQIVRTMILNHHTDDFCTEMGELTFFMMHSFGESDIRNSARFYYGLMMLSSDAKAKEILQAALSDSLKLGTNIADFFPGSVPQVVPGEIKVLEPSPLACKRQTVSVHHTQAGGSVLSYNGSIEAYRDALGCVSTEMECVLSACIIEDRPFDHVLAVSFHLTEPWVTSLDEEISLPFLNKGEVASVIFRMKPSAPKPMCVNLRAMYVQGSGTFQCSLEPIPFGLSDFLLAFPWHLVDVTDRRQFFDDMWQDLVTEAGDSDTKNAESLKCMKADRKFLADKWSAGHVGGDQDGLSPDEGSQLLPDCFLFFMPPMYHLLFRVQGRSNDVVVQIASDYYPILGYIDEFLDSFVPN